MKLKLNILAVIFCSHLSAVTFECSNVFLFLHPLKSFVAFKLGMTSNPGEKKGWNFPEGHKRRLKERERIQDGK